MSLFPELDGVRVAELPVVTPTQVGRVIALREVEELREKSSFLEFFRQSEMMRKEELEMQRVLRKRFDEMQTHEMLRWRVANTSGEPVDYRKLLFFLVAALVDGSAEFGPEGVEFLVSDRVARDADLRSLKVQKSYDAANRAERIAFRVEAPGEV